MMQNRTNNASNAIILFSHLTNKSISDLMNAIAGRRSVVCDHFFGGYFQSAIPDGFMASDPWRLFYFTERQIRSLPYESKIHDVKNWNTLRGSPDLPLLALFLQNKTYDYYWFIEYDVRYSGDWPRFFDELSLSGADLLCAHVTPRRAGDGWPYWTTFSSGTSPIEPSIRCFLPLCRVSRRLLTAIDLAYRNGWSGHPEVVWPTVAKYHDLVIEDIGGNGLYTPPSRRDRFYFSHFVENKFFLSTFAAWPAYSAQNDFNGYGVDGRKDILWHPVK